LVVRFSIPKGICILERGVSLRFSDWYKIFVLDSVKQLKLCNVAFFLEYQLMDRVQETSTPARMSTSTHS